MKVNLFVMGQYRGEIEIGENSLIAKVIQGDLAGMMQSASSLQNEIAQVAKEKKCPHCGKMLCGNHCLDCEYGWWNEKP